MTMTATSLFSFFLLLLVRGASSVLRGRTLQSACKTISGQVSNATCVFPFKFGGNTYSGCSFHDAELDEDGNPIAWCSTRTDASDAHIGGACNLHHGCIPFLYPYPKPAELPEGGTDGDERLRWALQQLRKHNLVEEGDYVVLAHGWKTGVQSLSAYRVLKVGDNLEDQITGSQATATTLL